MAGHDEERELGMIERIADLVNADARPHSARTPSQHHVPDRDRRPGLSHQDHRGPHRLGHAGAVRHAELQLCAARAARRMGAVLDQAAAARPSRHLRAVQARQARHRRRSASADGEPALLQGCAGRAAQARRRAKRRRPSDGYGRTRRHAQAAFRQAPTVRARLSAAISISICSAGRTGSTSRRPARAFRCSACTPRAPTAGSIAGCSTTSASPTTTASSCSTCRGTANRRRPRAIRTRNTS